MQWLNIGPAAVLKKAGVMGILHMENLQFIPAIIFKHNLHHLLMVHLN